MPQSLQRYITKLCFSVSVFSTTASTNRRELLMDKKYEITTSQLLVYNSCNWLFSGCVFSTHYTDSLAILRMLFGKTHTWRGSPTRSPPRGPFSSSLCSLLLQDSVCANLCHKASSWHYFENFHQMWISPVIKFRRRTQRCFKVSQWHTWRIEVHPIKHGLSHYALTAEPHDFQMHITNKHTKIQEMQCLRLGSWKKVITISFIWSFFMPATMASTS